MLRLPERIYKKFADSIVQEYFKDEKCEITKKSELLCKSKIDIGKLDSVLIELTLNGVEVEFPISALITTCSDKKCSLLFGLSKEKKTILLGTFIFDIFVVEHLSS